MLHSYTSEDTQLARWWNYAEKYQIRATKGKFDYGTEDDGILSFPNKIHYKEYRYPLPSIARIENEYAGDEDIIIATGLSGDLAMYNPTIKTGTGFVDIFCTDLDDFEGEEIVRVNNYVSGNYDRVAFTVYTPNLYAGIASKYTRQFDFSTLLSDNRGTKSITPKFYFTGDFDGNGKMEILAFSGSNIMDKGNASNCYLFDLENNRKLYEASPFNYYVRLPRYGSGGTISADDAYAASDKLYAIDYDGDGKTDLCLINDEGMHVYTFDVSGSSYSLRKVKSDSDLTKGMLKNRDFLAGELNGDGKTDFLLSPTIGGGTTWNIYFSKSDGYFQNKSLSITTKIESSRFMLQDMNGDGQSDLVESYGSPFATYFLVDGTYKGYCVKILSNKTILVPSNIQSRNHFSQLIGINPDGKANRIRYNNNYTKSRYLTGIIDSYGKIYKYDYRQRKHETIKIHIPTPSMLIPIKHEKPY
jgi:hypothetical protein